MEQNMETNMEIAIMGYVGGLPFLPSYPKANFAAFGGCPSGSLTLGAPPKW